MPFNDEQRDDPREQPRHSRLPDDEPHRYENDQLGTRNRRRHYYDDVWYARAVAVGIGGLFLATVHQMGLPPFGGDLSVVALACFFAAISLAGVTLEHIARSIENGRRCLLLAWPDTAESIAQRLDEHPKCMRSFSDEDGAHRLYNANGDLRAGPDEIKDYRPERMAHS